MTTKKAQPKAQPSAELKAEPTKTSKKDQELLNLQHEADVRIQHLRSVLKDVSRVYVANQEQRLIEIADHVSAPSKKGKGKAVSGSKLSQIIEVLDAVNIKHEKGRRKDLKKIEFVIDTISSFIPEDKE